MPTDFYNKVFKECEDFFGPNTKRFLDRQIEAHVGKTPDDIEYTDREVLSKWVRISAGLILDKIDAEKLASKITDLT